MSGLWAGWRRAMQGLRHTPLHPQWLLGSRQGTARWVQAQVGATVLDIGCADRWIEPWLRRSRYLALDYPPTGSACYGARPDLFADAARLPLRDESVDSVLLLDVLEHLADPSAALDEIGRVLKPGGKLMLQVPFLYPVHDAPHDYQRYTEFGLQREMTARGLRVETLMPTMGSAESAALILNLALAGMLLQGLSRRTLVTFLLMPLLAILIVVVNLSGWLLGRLLPGWSAVCAGYRLVAVRPMHCASVVESGAP